MVCPPAALAASSTLALASLACFVLIRGGDSVLSGDGASAASLLASPPRQVGTHLVYDDRCKAERQVSSLSSTTTDECRTVLRWNFYYDEKKVRIVA